jgi:hypothetical protein
MSETGRSRLRRDQLKSLVLDAGVELLLEAGLGAKTVQIGYADAFRWLQEHRSLTVSRAQIHRRIWNSLTEYRLEVMVNLVRFGWPGEIYDLTAREVRDAIQGLDVAGADGPTRIAILCDLARKMTNANAADSRGHRAIATAEALSAMHALGTGIGPATASVREAIVQNKIAILDQYVGLYGQVGESFDVVAGSAWGLDADDGMRMYAELLSCLNQGAAGRSTYEATLQELKVGDELWTVEGLGVHAITRHVASPHGPRAPRKEDRVVEPLPVTHSNNISEPTQIGHGKNSPVTVGHRMERNVLRQHMLDAGMAVLLEKGLGHGAEHITYSRVFERIERQSGVTVARAQVHRRIWASQNDFQLAVLAAVVRPNGIEGLERAAEASAQVLDEADLSSPSQVRLATARIVRAATIATAEELNQSPTWLVGRAVMAFHALDPGRSETVGTALHHEYEAGISGWAKLFEGLALTLGYRPRAWTKCSLEEICIVAARFADVLSDGVVARARMLGEEPVFRVSIAGDKPQDWNLLGIGTWCVIDSLMEPSV